MAKTTDPMLKLGVTIAFPPKETRQLSCSNAHIGVMLLSETLEEFLTMLPVLLSKGPTIRRLLP